MNNRTIKETDKVIKKVLIANLKIEENVPKVFLNLRHGIPEVLTVVRDNIVVFVVVPPEEHITLLRVSKRRHHLE